RLSRAKLVVTSRIHCALPCLAMGTPVIFLNGGFEGFGNRFNSRFEGLIDFFNRVDISEEGEISNNFGLKGKIEVGSLPVNKTRHVPYAEALTSRCQEFINNVEIKNL
ncbi:polysaccharide pyruvyl transferase family protein, partial [Sphingobacterium shayense]|uniref:polysaccharide pyruvyl transferase family protein n=1 Tax=Sphingobacterium shayense TaxID=626343 RepID=UPI0015540C86